MKIMTRIIRLWKADFNGFMDELEDKSLLIKQHLREMEDELDNKKQLFAALELEEEQFQNENKQFCHEQKELENDLKVAIFKKKDDIARMLIKKITMINKQLKNNNQQLLELAGKSQKLREKINEQSIQYKDLRLKAKEYLLRAKHNQEKFNSTEPLSQLLNIENELTNEEIELELLKYKEMFQTASQGEQ